MYARLWQRHGLACLIGFVFFFVVGGSCLFAALPDVENVRNGHSLGAVVAGPAIGLGALFLAGAYIFSLASSVADRLKELNHKIDGLNELLRQDRDTAGASSN